MKTRMKMSGLGSFGDGKHRIAFKTYRATLSVLILASFVFTSTLQDTIEEASHSEDPFLLPKALKQIQKSDDITKHLIRYMSNDMQIQEPNAIYLQCVVPQVKLNFCCILAR